MKGIIIGNRNIKIFLTKKEVDMLNSQVLRGSLINTQIRRIHSVNLGLSKEQFVYVGEGSNFYQILLPNEKYEFLKVDGHIETRYGKSLNKLAVFEESYANKDNNLKFELERLDKNLRNHLF